MNTETSEEKLRQSARRKRVNRLKKMILTTVFLLIVIPTVACVVLGICVYQQKNALEGKNRQIDWLEKSLQDVEDEVDRLSALLGSSSNSYQNLYDESNRQNPVLQTEVQENPENTVSGLRRVYLTFDDGPSDRTEQILDILDQYQVKATFFVVGRTEEKYKELYKRIVEEGHTLGMHSYSHRYSTIYGSPEAFLEDLNRLQQLILEETGQESTVFRFPGGSSNTVSRTDIQTFIQMLNEEGITYYDWNVSAGDAQSVYSSRDQIVQRVVSNVAVMQDSIVLMHDANDKGATVEALPIIIEKIQEMEDTCFLAIDKETPIMQHITAQAVR